MIVKNDQNIANFLDSKENGGMGFRYATANQLHELFFADASYRYSRKRLKYLTDIGFLSRTRSTIDSSFAYFVEKKSYIPQIHHSLLRTEVYVYMKKLYSILEWSNEHTLEHIRPEALAYVDDHGIMFPVLLEIHLSNQFNFDKYKRFIKESDMKSIFGTTVAPRVLICTDRKVTIPNIGIKFKVIDLKMSGLETLFK